MDLGFYTVIILAGYLATFEETPDLVVRRQPISGQYDVFMMIAQIAIAGALCVTIPMNFVPLRTAIYNHIFTDPALTHKR